MNEKNSERNLAGMVEAGLADEFSEQADRIGGKIKRHLAAAARLWISLPDDIKIRLLDQSVDATSFVAIVQEIVDERIRAGFEAGQQLVGRRKQKPRPRG
ncbi:MAG: hypothetical protein ACYTEQ_21740 [Planctomycetota bacterium]|jgi:hypothetical protein